MKLIDSLQSVFNKKACSCQCASDAWCIHESEGSAKFKTLTVRKKDAEFGIIDNAFYKHSIGAIAKNSSSFLKDKDCDGVSFIEEGETCQWFFVDLKSSLNDNEISEGFQQGFFSFMKMHMMSSLCDGYDVRSVNKIVFLVACQPCKSLDEESDIKQALQMSEELGELRHIDKCLGAYFYGSKEYVCTLGDIPLVGGKKLHKDILSINVSFMIFTPPNPNDDSGVLELD